MVPRGVRQRLRQVHHRRHIPDHRRFQLASLLNRRLDHRPLLQDHHRRPQTSHRHHNRHLAQLQVQAATGLPTSITRRTQSGKTVTPAIRSSAMLSPTMEQQATVLLTTPRPSTKQCPMAIDVEAYPTFNSATPLPSRLPWSISHQASIWSAHPF